MANDPVRTPEMLERYNKKISLDIPVDLLSLPHLVDFDHWVLIENEFPYDVIAKTHHILVSRRTGVKEMGDLNQDEFMEMLGIKSSVGHQYDISIENFPHARSVPERFHIHFVKYKKPL